MTAITVDITTTVTVTIAVLACSGRSRRPPGVREPDSDMCGLKLIPPEAALPASAVLTSVTSGYRVTIAASRG